MTLTWRLEKLLVVDQFLSVESVVWLDVVSVVEDVGVVGFEGVEVSAGPPGHHHAGVVVS